MFADGSLGVRHIWWLLRCSHLMFPLCIVCVSCWGSSHCRVWGGSVPSCFADCVPPNLGLLLFLLACSLLLVCSAGGAACRSLPPIVAVGLSHLQLGGTRGTGHFCTCLQIYKLTCQWCLLGLFWGECGALLLFCSLGRRGAPCLKTSLRAAHASELGTRVSPPPCWLCAVTTNGLDAVSHKRAQGPCTRPW